MRISQQDYNNFVGLIGVGRIQRGKVRTNMPVSVIDRHGKKRQGQVLQVLGFMGMERVEVLEAEAGDIVDISGVADIGLARKRIGEGRRVGGSVELGGRRIYDKNKKR